MKFSSGVVFPIRTTWLTISVLVILGNTSRLIPFSPLKESQGIKYSTSWRIGKNVVPSLSVTMLSFIKVCASNRLYNRENVNDS